MGEVKRIHFSALIALFFLVGIVTFGVVYGVYILINNGGVVLSESTVDLAEDGASELTDTPGETDEDNETDDTEPLEVDFSIVIDAWVKTVSGNKSIYIYDLDLQKETASYNLKEDYGTASLYKLFVVYEGYKRLQNGTWDGNIKAGSTGYTISKCLDLAIRESHSPCAETLWSMIGHDTLDEIIENEWEITDSDISKLTSNAVDIAKILQRFYDHPDFNDEKLLADMWDSFLNQPNTTYEWRQGLPSGFEKAKVYNKVGWAYNAENKYWNIYHDAAILKFPLEDGTTRNYIVVVLTNKIDFKDIRRLGKMLEEKFYENEI